MLGYGAWHAHTHATLTFYLTDRATRDSLRDAQLLLRDARGAPLAEVRLRPPHGLPQYVGAGAHDCTAEEGRGGAAWQACFEAHSRWLAGWVDRVASAELRSGNCHLANVPLTRAAYGDWWLWWVPLPHVGGTPIRDVSLRGAIDGARCVVVTGP